MRLVGWACFAVFLLGMPAGAEAVFVRETFQEIVAMRGMIPAMTTCLVGLALLRYLPAAAPPGRTALKTPTPRAMHWVVLFSYILVVYATIPFGFEVVSFIVKRIGIRAFRGGVNGLGLMAALLFVWYVIFRARLRHAAVYAGLAAAVLIYAYFFIVLEVPVKRIHFLEFSFLSFLLYQALRPFAGPPAIYLWIPLGTLLVGIGDESIALIFPRRFAAVSDVIWDTTGGILGTLVLKFVVLKA